MVRCGEGVREEKDMAERNEFTDQEAHEKIGGRVRLKNKEYIDVPEGTLGTVTGMEMRLPHVRGQFAWELIVVWDGLDPGIKLNRDWFGKARYEYCLEEID
jgi:hypothetical protein